MYPRNAASPPRIAIGAVVQISDGAVQTSGCTVRVIEQGGAEGDGGGTTAYSTDGIVLYTPTQAETDQIAFVVIAKKTGCIPVSQTIITSASDVTGYAGVDWSKVNAPTTTQGLTGTTIATTQKVDVETIKTNPVVNAGTVTFPTGATLASTTNITAGTISTVTTLTNLPAITANWLTATGIAASALDGKGNWNVGKTGYELTPTTGLGNQTANITGNLSGSVGSVTGAVGSVTGAVGSVTGAVGSVTGLTASDVGAIKAKTDSLTFTVANKVDSNVLAVDGVVDAADRLQKVVQGNVFGTCDAGSSTTSIITSALDPAAAVIDQFKGRILTFKNDTTTANLRGQSTDITGSTALGVLTVTALTTAPASGDTFTIS